MEPSVESLCNILARSKLVPPEEIRTLYQRWAKEAGPDSADVAKFTHWLAANQIATEYQIGVLQRGNAHQLFLNQYTILERVGKGRLAGVYRASHRLGQIVAIKVLPSSKAKDPTILARFRRESRLAIKLKHPNIVRTFQTGKANNLHYLVMELLEGEMLQDVLKRRGQLPLDEAVRIVHQALLGLEHIREQGLVHRDLKPGNLMLAPGYGPTTVNDTVKILDIGTGRALFDEGAAGADDFDITNTTDVLGTPEYMAPEQARNPHAADVRSDIYSLGCVLFHAFTGRPPFTDTNTVRLLVKHSTDPIPSVRQLNPAVPEGLEQILNWMLAKDPAKRYPTPARAAQALEVFLASGGQESKPTDARLTAYLKWLESQKPDDVDDEPPATTQRAGGVSPLLVPKQQGAHAPRSPGSARSAPTRSKAPQPSQDYDVEPVDPQTLAGGKPSSPMNQQTLFLILAIVFGVFLIVCAGGVGTTLLVLLRP